MNAARLPSAKQLAEVFSYDPKSGNLFWTTGKAAGEVAGWKNYKENGDAGSIRLRFKFDGRFVNMTASRVAWMLTNGDITEEVLIDHKDGNPFNNRLTNLRPCDNQQNAMNQRVPSHNISGKRGVSFHVRTGKWQAEIYHKKTHRYLGLYTNKAEAIAARVLAETELFGDFSPLVSRNGVAS